MSHLTDNRDRHGLETLAKAWTPASLRKGGSDAEGMLASWQAAMAVILNPAIDLAAYAPSIYNPAQCLPAQLPSILQLNGIQDVRQLTPAQRRRLAVIAATLRWWRGASRSTRAVVGALTGGPVILRTWIDQRYVLGVSTVELVELDENQQDVTLVYCLGQGPSATYDEDLLQAYLQAQAIGVTDQLVLVPAWALTAWRSGTNGWDELESGVTVVPTAITDSYEGIDLTGETSLCPLTSPTSAAFPSLRITVWFKTDGATGLVWRVWLPSSPDGSQGYAIEVPAGPGQLRYLRKPSGSEVELAAWPLTVEDGLTGGYHRLDVTAIRYENNITLRAWIDHNALPQCVDTVANTVTGGTARLTTSSSFTGILRVAAIVLQE